MARTQTPARTVAVAGAVVALVATAAGCGASAGDDRHPEHRAFALHGRTLTVDSDDSALELVVAESAEADKVEVTRWFQGHVVVGGDPRVTWAMKDDRLTLRMKCSGVVADCSARHRIVVPRGVAVKVVDGDGSVRAEGFKEALGIRTSDGSVRVTNSSGALDLRTADGSIHALGIGSRRVRAQSSDGSVQLELGVVPDLVEARSQDGSLTIGLPHDTYRVTAESGDGSVRVSVPRDPASSHVVSAHANDGSITVRTAN
ncbi:DUF4097 family beta strand repeat-containing protein [Streptomyces sp. RLB1-33]|uniref:DUF4097 family beta strand repeat-containing protein n=1 Tax=Streptomyces mirabilis TaxID=68239 RepID=UPI00143E7A55|nr:MULTISPECIES: DUF4097 family beta strand repeat-containing protein [Streptomyces]QIY70799.1 DUF4097 domain-containing protein [Streptomyces sp. RLB1-33]QUW82281.1 DUF4097 family beta strand repeat protein [Streptomyces mirabilis]